MAGLLQSVCLRIDCVSFAGVARSLKAHLKHDLEGLGQDVFVKHWDRPPVDKRGNHLPTPRPRVKIVRWGARDGNEAKVDYVFF